ncbi:MAG: serine/threonine-protein kinase [Kofleriaceae bacterium]|nr:serine/threonine-protein kinase [Kofleriaceae bacterium]
MEPVSAAVELYCPTCERSYHAGRLCEVDGTELVNLGGGPDPLIGRALNERYTIHERLGAGGMGTVYRGVQHSVGREVAIKVVSAGLVTDPAAIKRFLREAKLASRLSHPNAVSMLDFGQTPDGLFYLVMELLVGRTLDKVLRDEVRLALPRVLRIASQVCDALDGAHRLSIIHRDLKPANVMLLDGDRDLIKVLDFGLAKSLSQDTTSLSMTASGAMLGTPAYMSPEAALGRELDARCDLYSLGCMLYVLASGRLPFHSDSVHELVAMHASEPPAPITGVPHSVGEVIMRLLAKEPQDRYESAAAARVALEEAAARASTMDALATTLPPSGIERPPSRPAVDVNAMTVQSGPGVTERPEPAGGAVAGPTPTVAVAPTSRVKLAIVGAVLAAGAGVGAFAVLGGDGGAASSPELPAAASPASPPSAAPSLPAAAAPSTAPSAAASPAPSAASPSASPATASSTSTSSSTSSQSTRSTTARKPTSSKPPKTAAPPSNASTSSTSPTTNTEPPTNTSNAAAPPTATAPPATTAPPTATAPPATTAPPKKGSTPW